MKQAPVLTILLGCATGLLIPSSGSSATQRFVAETPTKRIDYWQKRAAEIDRQLNARASLRTIRIVFIGDSITDFWHLDANPWFPGKYCGRAIWNETFAGSDPALTALNLGVSGDRIEHVLHRLLPKRQGGDGWLDRPDLRPERIFLMLGINNSFDSEPPATLSIARGIEATIARIRAQKPSAEIVVQSLLPTDDPIKNRDLVLPVNARLRTFAARSVRVRFLDLYPAFIDKTGNQASAWFNDGLHPNRDGYRVWRDQIVAFLGAR